MALNIKIENFEGPFDLLLHLIKKNEMDIYDIKIYDITNQYLKYLDGMKEMDLDSTSEFIVTAATLLEIKSKMLLPKTKKDEESEEEEDPRQELVSKLLEYKKFKLVANFLADREKKVGVVFQKKPEIIEEKKDNRDNKDILKDITILHLFNIYNELITNYHNKMNTDSVMEREIPLDKFKIEDKMVEISNEIINNQKIYFSNLMNKCSSKIERVVTFLALLELIKLRMVSAIQEGNFKEIYIEEISSNDR
ncbi:segregation/condensation protein A [Clostridium ganghwense]|uniref:Segregation and condensation protein A n=1 Tax=Clostridium ganghwense TaxID=312089 RepID=A0ABT4CMM0_9CLOT|nr:segregation/condensation protein A [Clostridium ganghwense]MCY6370296.1 segregation/condensation protein A [Clostridium ganghwense]